MENTENKRIFDLTAFIAVLVLIIIGLGAYIFIDFRTDYIAARSEQMMESAGMNGSARCLVDDINSGDSVMAYHHASEAAVHAYRAGDKKAGAMFDEISEAIIDGRSVGGVAAQIDGFLACGEVPEKLVIGEKESVATMATSYSASEAAGKFFGTPVLVKGEKLTNGRILFSVSNAYAVIDEDKCVPIEAAISLPEGEGVLGASECVSSAMKFLAEFFPAEVVNSSFVTDVSSSNGGKRADVSFESAAMTMTVTVRRDTGRVVRFVSDRK